MALSSLNHANSSGSSLFAVLSLNILQSLTEEKIQSLKAIGINSIGDLLHYKPIHHAQVLMAVHRGEIGHDILLDKYLDTAYINTPPSGLADLALIAIEGIGASTELILQDSFGITTVRELSVFPAYIEAQSFLAPDEEVFNEPASAPEDLMPKIIGSTHSIARFNSYIKDEEIVLESKLIASMSENEPNSELYEIFNSKFPKLYTGFIAGFKQKWVNMGTHLGEIVHSLALAPGESRNIAIIEWYRRQLSSRDEDTVVDERLSNSFTHTRALNEVVKTTAQEHLSGSTEMESATKTSGWGITAGYGGGSSTGGSGSADLSSVAGFPLKLAGSFLKSSAGAIGVSAVFSNNEQTGTIKSESSGIRDVMGQVQQNLNDSTVQNSSNIRSLYSTIVVTDEQSEKEEIQTRNVTNYNHSHALTIQYYEVLQKYQILIGLDTWQAIIFVPFRPIYFTMDVIQKYWHVLKEPFGETFPDKIETFNTIITEYSPDNAVFNPNGDIYVQNVKITAALSAYPNYMYEKTVVGGGLGGNTTEQIEVDINDIFEIRVFNQDKTETIITHNTQEAVKTYSFSSVQRNLNSFKIVNFRLNSSLDFPNVFNLGAPYFTLQDVVASLSLLFDFDIKDSDGNSLHISKKYDGLSATYNQLYGSNMADVLSIQAVSDLAQDIKNAINTSINYNQAAALTEIETHFNHYRYGYTRLLLSAIESDQLIDIIESISLTVGGVDKELTDYLHPSPIGITENYLLFKPKKLPLDANGNPITNGDPILEYINNLYHSLEEYKASQSKTKIQDTVYLPTAGVFAEAILGRANASEYVNPRRFWNWQDSPIPHLAPQIAAITAGNHTVTDPSGVLTPNVPTSNLNIINPPQYPLTTSLDNALLAVQNGNMFRDMSKSGELVTVMGKLADLANNTAQLAGNLSGEAAENALNGAVELGKQVAGMVNEASKNLSTGTKSNTASPPETPTSKAAALNNLDQIEKNANARGGEITPIDKAKADAMGTPINTEENQSGESGNNGEDSEGEGESEAERITAMEYDNLPDPVASYFPPNSGDVDEPMLFSDLFNNDVV